MKKLSGIKTVLVVLLVVWAGTFSYIWLPGIVPNFLNLGVNLAPKKDGRLLDDLHNVASGLVNLSRKAAVTRPAGETVHVVIMSDSHTVGGMVTLIHSIVSHTHSPISFHLITDAETSSHLGAWLTQTKLRSITFEIKEFPVHWVKGKIKIRGGRAELGNPLNYARFFLPDLFPGIHGRVVYIDDDCIVQGDIAELFHVPLLPGTLAAFSEDCKGIHKHISFMQNVYADFFVLTNRHYQELDIDPRACAFNTGVFVTNLTEWRQHNITNQLLYWLELNTKEELYGNEKGGGGSQPPMMLVFYKKYTPLDQLWHVHYLGWTPRTSYSHAYIQSAKLLHWNGRFKPWGRVASFQHVWDKYYLPDPTLRFQPVRRTSDFL